MHNNNIQASQVNRSLEITQYASGFLTLLVTIVALGVIGWQSSLAGVIAVSTQKDFYILSGLGAASLVIWFVATVARCVKEKKQVSPAPPEPVKPLPPPAVQPVPVPPPSASSQPRPAPIPPPSSPASPSGPSPASSSAQPAQTNVVKPQPQAPASSSVPSPSPLPSQAPSPAPSSRPAPAPSPQQAPASAEPQPKAPIPASGPAPSSGVPSAQPEKPKLEPLPPGPMPIPPVQPPQQALLVPPPALMPYIAPSPMPAASLSSLPPPPPLPPLPSNLPPVSPPLPIHVLKDMIPPSIPLPAPVATLLPPPTLIPSQLNASSSVPPALSASVPPLPPLSGYAPAQPVPPLPTAAIVPPTIASKGIIPSSIPPLPSLSSLPIPIATLLPPPTPILSQLNVPSSVPPAPPASVPPLPPLSGYATTKPVPPLPTIAIVSPSIGSNAPAQLAPAVSATHSVSASPDPATSIKSVSASIPTAKPVESVAPPVPPIVPNAPAQPAPVISATHSVPTAKSVESAAPANAPVQPAAAVPPKASVTVATASQPASNVSASPAIPMPSPAPTALPTPKPTPAPDLSGLTVVKIPTPAVPYPGPQVATKPPLGTRAGDSMPPNAPAPAPPWTREDVNAMIKKNRELDVKVDDEDEADFRAMLRAQPPPAAAAAAAPAAAAPVTPLKDKEIEQLLNLGKRVLEGLVVADAKLKKLSPKEIQAAKKIVSDACDWMIQFIIKHAKVEKLDISYQAFDLDPGERVPNKTLNGDTLLNLLLNTPLDVHLAKILPKEVGNNNEHFNSFIMPIILFDGYSRLVFAINKFKGEIIQISWIAGKLIGAIEVFRYIHDHIVNNFKGSHLRGNVERLLSGASIVFGEILLENAPPAAMKKAADIAKEKEAYAAKLKQNSKIDPKVLAKAQEEALFAREREEATRMAKVDHKQYEQLVNHVVGLVPLVWESIRQLIKENSELMHVLKAVFISSALRIVPKSANQKLLSLVPAVQQEINASFDELERILDKPTEIKLFKDLFVAYKKHYEVLDALLTKPTGTVSAKDIANLKTNREKLFKGIKLPSDFYKELATELERQHQIFADSETLFLDLIDLEAKLSELVSKVVKKEVLKKENFEPALQLIAKFKENFKHLRPRGDFHVNERIVRRAFIYEKELDLLQRLQGISSKFEIENILEGAQGAFNTFPYSASRYNPASTKREWLPGPGIFFKQIKEIYEKIAKS